MMAGINRYRYKSVAMEENRRSKWGEVWGLCSMLLRRCQETSVNALRLEAQGAGKEMVMLQV
jgi:hypothetical protein